MILQIFLPHKKAPHPNRSLVHQIQPQGHANTDNGYVLQSILTGTYVEKPVENNNKVKPVPAEDFNSQDFQG